MIWLNFYWKCSSSVLTITLCGARASAKREAGVISRFKRLGAQSRSEDLQTWSRTFGSSRLQGFWDSLRLESFQSRRDCRHEKEPSYSCGGFFPLESCWEGCFCRTSQGGSQSDVATRLGSLTILRSGLEACLPFWNDTYRGLSPALWCTYVHWQLMARCGELLVGTWSCIQGLAPYQSWLSRPADCGEVINQDMDLLQLLASILILKTLREA